MEEYKIIVGTAMECQKWLNQWKHEYKLKILQMSADKDVTIILLIRERK